jgi:uncharacterized protein YjbJ (UPF0337 family)
LQAGHPVTVPGRGLSKPPNLETTMGESRAEETSKGARDSVKDAIGKIMGKPEVQNEGAAKSLSAQDMAEIKDQPGEVSKPH